MNMPVQATWKDSCAKVGHSVDILTDKLAPWVVVVGTAYVAYHNWTRPEQWVDYCNAIGKCVLINENPGKSYLAPIIAMNVVKLVKLSIKQIATGRTDQ